ncbi:MAG: hypothetical protein KatS3mg003_2288 [Candidatus Nitrosocaldaceae archaeon]|nr:MAG: hypothetical protein KatS3mg003_2288 [Candidatus Nitrosocaldaceae archaeon]
MEYNENRFVSYFTDKFDIGCATLYANKVMNDDPFFNRLTNIRCKDLDKMIYDAEDIFKSINVKPFIHCMEERLRRVLEEHNYYLFDKISVLLFESPYAIKGVKGITINKISSDELDLWLDVYCIAFDSLKYRDELKDRLMNADLDLYIAKVKDKVAGCMALLATKELLGLYCLGVLPEYRRLGIASSLLRYGYEHANSNGLMLFLQTFVSENLIRYYIKHGFTQMYIKDVYSKDI